METQIPCLISVVCMKTKVWWRESGFPVQSEKRRLTRNRTMSIRNSRARVHQIFHSKGHEPMKLNDEHSALADIPACAAFQKRFFGIYFFIAQGRFVSSWSISLRLEVGPIFSILCMCNRGSLTRFQLAGSATAVRPF